MSFYAEVFGGAAQLYTLADLNRSDGPPEAIAHGFLVDAPVALFGADATGDQRPLRCEGLMLSLLGSATAATLRRWFSRLSEGGRVVDELTRRPWGAFDGRVVDRFGLCWLIGFEEDVEA